MELIPLSGYTPNEKIAIARQFLVPKQREANGLKADQIEIADEAILSLITNYTREAGVRNLEREIGSVCRKVARKIVQKSAETPLRITPDNLRDFLGKFKYRNRRKGEVSEIGVATGLAWTEAGGEILAVETSLLKGKGNLTLTGSLGDVMQESARAGVSYVRSRAEMYDADPNFHEKFDIHIHVPEGAIPKDGPSAGITMAVSLFSAVTKIPVLKDVAMTGEVTLRGKVLPVGGIKDKVLAAYRAGIRTIILSFENDKDLDELPEEIRKEMEFHLVSNMDEVIKVAMEGVAPTAAPLEPDARPAEGGTIAH
jgi:ATP-dependent Lon protease